MQSRSKLLLLLVLLVFSATIFFGCVERHIKAPKFDIYPDKIPSFQGDMLVAVIIPEPAKEDYFVKYADPKNKHAAKIFVDLNGMHTSAKELIEKELANHNIESSALAEKQLKFTITDVQWEVWAGGFSMGAYLEFDVETSTGYKAHYKVQDGSGADLSRALGGTVSRAVEKIFQDPEIIKYLQGF